MRVYGWRRLMLHLLFKWNLMIRLSAIAAPHIDLQSLLSMSGVTGMTVRRRPKDPTMPGLSRLKRPELLRLAEAYSLKVPPKASLEEIRNMLYNAEPTMAEGRYQRRGNERHKGGKPAATSSGPSTAAGVTGPGSSFEVVTSSDEESWDEVFMGVREPAETGVTGVKAPGHRLYILDDWRRPPIELPRCLECGERMDMQLPPLATPNVIPRFSCKNSLYFKCFGMRSLTDVYGKTVVAKMKEMADISHDSRTARA